MATSAVSLSGAALLLLGCVLSCRASAESLPPPAYRLAAQRAGIPATVLFAVALQESGARLHGRLIPWPWTLNVAGSAERFATRGAACSALYNAIAHTPANRIDAGLGQINLGYHRQRYRDPCELLDPYRNLAVAADLLDEQHAAGEDWLLAVGRYHHPAGGETAARYRHRVNTHLTGLLRDDRSQQAAQHGDPP